MKTDFFIHFENEENSNELELKTLCESLLGFESLLKEFTKISKINWEIEIKTKASKDGSYVEWLVLVFDFIEDIPFKTLQDFLEFMQVIDFKLHQEATNFFNTNGYDLKTLKDFLTQISKGNTSIQRSVNNFAKERPGEFSIILAIIVLLLPIFYFKFFKKIKQIKSQNKPDKDTSLPMFKKLKTIIKKGLPKKAMRSFIEGQVEKIGFSSNGRQVDEGSIIDRQNFGNLLPDSEELFPTYINGSKHEFVGELKNFHSAKGDFMKIKINLGEYGNHILVVKPDEHHETKDFREFYKEEVTFEAEVLRESLFEKPKLKILGEMEKVKKEMFPEK